MRKTKQSVANTTVTSDSVTHMTMMCNLSEDMQTRKGGYLVEKTDSIVGRFIVCFILS